MPGRVFGTHRARPGLSGREQHTYEGCAERGEQSECGEDAAERGSTPRDENVCECADPGHGDEDQFHRQGRQVAAGLVAGVHCEQVPDAGDEQKSERRPSDELEAARDRTRGLDAAEPANDRYDTRERDLSADPHRSAKNVQEQPDGRGMDWQHERRLRRAPSRPEEPTEHPAPNDDSDPSQNRRVADALVS
jgi:hypothetical protein